MYNLTWNLMYGSFLRNPLFRRKDLWLLTKGSLNMVKYEDVWYGDWVKDKKVSKGLGILIT